MDNAFEELDCFLSSSRDKRFVLDPLGELVDGHVHILETCWRRLERPDHVQSLACERPGNWDGLQFLCRYVYLLGEKLASFTASNEVFYIGDGCGPVKTDSKSFADQVSRGRVIAIGTRMNFMKQLHSFVLRDALLQYPFLGTLPHQVTVHQHIVLASVD